MALDGIYLSLLRKEFDPLIDGRVDKIHQPSREELIMTIRTKEGAQKLMFSTGAGSARVHITTADIENPKTPPMFCMLMRKHLAGADSLQLGRTALSVYFSLTLKPPTKWATG